MKKVNGLFWTMDLSDVQTAHCFSGYYGFTYFRIFSPSVFKRNFYKL